MASFTIAGTHPSLIGHFPGNPIVPGVVVLEQVLHCLGITAGEPLEFSDIKFRQPLAPDATATVVATESGDKVRFSVEQQSALILSGTLVRRRTARAD